MKDTEMHNHLELGDVRDGISRQLSQAHIGLEMPNEYDKMPNTRDHIELTLWRIETHKNHIAYRQRSIDAEIVKIGLYSLMKCRGWIEHDVSDEIGKTGKHYLNFIGTQDEYDEFIKMVS